MKSIQTKLILVISVIIIVVVGAFLLTATARTNAILNDDSQDLLISVADYYANVIDDNFRSTEQSVGTIYNYAIQREESYPSFKTDLNELDGYTYDISELGKSIAENTRGAMSVYMRYNPYDFPPTSGFWYTYDIDSKSWIVTVPTDYSMYSPDDAEHVGWYYIPVGAGVPLWMDPYYNANIGVYMISYIIPYFLDDYTVGIIGMDISMELLKESVSEVSVYDTGRAFLIDRSGNVMYHEAYPDGADFADLSAADKEYFRGVVQLTTNEPDVFAARDGSDQKLILRELKNGMILGIYAPLSEINRPQRTLLTQFLVITAVILVLAILAGLLFVRSLTNPLKKMTAVAEHYADGDFTETMSTSGKDEIGILSRSLQVMATSLKEQIRLAADASKAKSDFLANMSHEIRTPINAVLGMNEMILHEAKDDNILEYSNNIQAAGKTLLSLINTILDFSKIEGGKMEIIPANYDTASVINNLVNSIQERARDKHLDLILDIDHELPCTLFGDDIRVSQVIMNLLTNAVKYTEKGSVTLSIRAGGRIGDDLDLKVAVKDTGIGIREEDMPKLFASFERIEEKRNRNIEGTGLGMAIVNKLLAMMGSKLNVKSVYGEGSEFSFDLHQRVIDSRPIGDYAERLRESAAHEEKGTMLKATGAKILVVDDNEMNLKVAANLLKLNGIVPDLADSGLKSIEMIRKKDYDIVFLDHMMPKMDGIETLQELRKQGLPKAGTKVIALTANAIVGAKETYLAAGFDDYLSKPIELPKMEELLKRYLPAEKVSYVTAEEAEAAAAAARAASAKKAETAGSADDGYAPLRNAGIDPKTGLSFCSNDEEFYRSILQDYAKSADEKTRAMTGFFGAADWKNYAILVHALKSTSKTIGAAELSALAAKLETAATAGDGDTILAGHETMMRMYAAVAGAITETLPEAAKPAGAEGTSGEDEALEFLPDENGAQEFLPEEDEVLEFAPEEDEVLEFTPEQ